MLKGITEFRAYQEDGENKINIKYFDKKHTFKEVTVNQKHLRKGIGREITDFAKSIIDEYEG